MVFPCILFTFVISVDTVEFPSTCSEERWKNEQVCQLQFTKLNELFDMPENSMVLRLTLSKCDEDVSKRSCGFLFSLSDSQFTTVKPNEYQCAIHPQVALSSKDSQSCVFARVLTVGGSTSIHVHGLCWRQM